MGEALSPSCVSILSCSAYPLTVADTVIPIHIRPIQAVPQAGSKAHIVKKGIEAGQPREADANAPAPVLLVRCGTRDSTTTNHTVPSRELRRLGPELSSSEVSSGAYDFFTIDVTTKPGCMARTIRPDPAKHRQVVELEPYQVFEVMFRSHTWDYTEIWPKRVRKTKFDPQPLFPEIHFQP